VVDLYICIAYKFAKDEKHKVIEIRLIGYHAFVDLGPKKLSLSFKSTYEGEEGILVSNLDNGPGYIYQNISSKNHL